MMMINSVSPIRDPSYRRVRLQDGAAALFSKRVDFLAGEADEQTIFLLMFSDVLDDLRNCLGNRHSLDCSLATQLLGHHPKTTPHYN